jgi:hypothetical protein
VALVVCLAVASAEANDSRAEVFVFAGTSLLNASNAIAEACGDDSCEPFQVRSHLDTSLLAGLSVGYRVAPRTDVELSFSAALSHDLNVRAEVSFLPEPIEAGRDIRTYHLAASVRYDLGDGDTRPFLIGGLGLLLYEARDELRIGGPDGDWALLIGGGVSRPLGTRLRARLEIVDHLVPGHFVGDKLVHDVHARLGVSVRF